MSVEKRMMLAVAVSFVVIVVWSLVFMPEQTTPETEEQNTSETAEPADAAPQSDEAETDSTGEEEQQEPETGEITAAEDSPEAGTEEQEITQAETAPAFAEEKQTVTIESSRFKAVLSNEHGGSISEFMVKKHDEPDEFYEESRSEDNLDLVAKEEFSREPFALLGTAIRDDNSYEALSGFAVMDAPMSGGEVISVEEQPVTIRFTYKKEGEGEVEKSFVFRPDSYIFDVTVSTIPAQQTRNLVHTMGPGVGQLLLETDGAYTSVNEGNGWLLREVNGGVNRRMHPVRDRGKPKENEMLRTPNFEVGKQEWAGLSNNYFMTLVFTGNAANAELINVRPLISVQNLVSGEEEKYYEFPYLEFDTSPQRNATFQIYAGPKSLEVLEHEADGALKDVISFGWFSFISRPALWLLKQIHTFTHNYGFAIIILTVLINILLLPLIISQRKSMVAMQRLQPQLKSIQAKYKAERGDDIKTRQDKKQKLNEEMMALYKQEKVNPMGGCLPLLIQMPILFALFDMFRVAIELRKAPFIFWWQDLSTADPTFVLPILMGTAMFLQQRLTPAPAESQSAAIKMLPFLFVFLLASAPSGLVLYWTTSSAFNMVTQIVMNKTIADVRQQHIEAKQRKAASKKAKKGGKKK